MSVPPVAYVTDLEGNAQKLANFMRGHEAFAWGTDGRYHLREGHIFIHGGDAPDRFLGSITVVDELVRLKEETPDRVYLIAGNRDVNKLRLPMELSAIAMREEPRVRCEDWRSWLATQLGVGPTDQLLARDTRGLRLRWILKRTMGAPDAYELRQKELELASLAHDDQAIVDSFLTDLAPGGRFRRFLEYSCLMHRVGNTLYTHAGLTKENLEQVPGSGPERDLDSWIGHLNRWYLDQLAQWKADNANWAGADRRPGEDLIDYCQPRPNADVNQASVVYSRNADREGKITLPPEPVIAFLRSQGIHRMVVGHTPSGQIPVLLRSTDDGFEQLVADTSRSPDADHAPLVTVEGGDQLTTRIRSKLILVDGTPANIAFKARLGLPSPLGKTLPDGGVVVAPLGEEFVSYSLKPGWKVEYHRHQAGGVPPLAAGAIELESDQGVA
jgi:hypothetical protein